ncbi:MAG: glycosyltransferase family 2 protein [Pseudomonadota bacterium]
MHHLVTPLILTLNEEPNIKRCLDAVSWADDIVVVDSGSTDQTLEICASFKQVRVVKRAFDTHANQWNYGLEQIGANRWVLALDADHIVSQDFRAELDTLDIDKHTGFQSGFIYKEAGKTLRGSLYPPLVSLYLCNKGKYVQDGHTQRLILSGELGTIKSKNFHDDRKSWQRWRQSQMKYARLEKSKLAKTKYADLRWTERIRLVPFFSPVLVLIYTSLYQGLLLDGKAGMIYITKRVLAEWILHTTSAPKTE